MKKILSFLLVALCLITACRKKNNSAEVTTVAGTGTMNFVDGKGADASFSNLMGLAIDPADNIYVADATNNRVMRYINGAAQGSIVVGGNRHGPQPNQLYNPVGLSFDRHGNLYVVEYGNHRVQKFNINLNA